MADRLTLDEKWDAMPIEVRIKAKMHARMVAVCESIPRMADAERHRAALRALLMEHGFTAEEVHNG